MSTIGNLPSDVFIGLSLPEREGSPLGAKEQQPNPTFLEILGLKQNTLNNTQETLNSTYDVNTNVAVAGLDDVEVRSSDNGALFSDSLALNGEAQLLRGENDNAFSSMHEREVSLSLTGLESALPNVLFEQQAFSSGKLSYLQSIFQDSYAYSTPLMTADETTFDRFIDRRIQLPQVASLPTVESDAISSAIAYSGRLSAETRFSTTKLSSLSSVINVNEVSEYLKKNSAVYQDDRFVKVSIRDYSLTMQEAERLLSHLMATYRESGKTLQVHINGKPALNVNYGENSSCQ